MDVKLTSAAEFISRLDLSDISKKLIFEKKWLPNDAKEACSQYKNFLLLAKKYGDANLVPSEEIDEVWHFHILDTQKYRNDCKIIFGKYLDHAPQAAVNISNFENTRVLYESEFLGQK